jgi:hypothetical protein
VRGLDSHLRKRVHPIAGVRGCSMNALLNPGLSPFYSRWKEYQAREFKTDSTGACMAAYDEMSEAERRQLAEVLGSLTGLQSGPTGSLPDGTHYEYDPTLKATVEVTPSGDRYPVTLVDGRFIRAGERAVAHKTGE